MTTHNEAHAPGSSRKVRLACRRCRVKRIKCDGSIPACGNCTRAGVSCVDVDSRNGDLFIPRDYITKSQNRIRWLEEKIQLLDPDFDRSQGPAEQYAINGGSSAVPEGTNGAGNPRNDSQSLNSDHQPETSTRKRSFASLHGPDQTAFPSAEARSVTMDLGMISLHSDSRQQSYLGSSSGRLFSRLIGAEGDNMSPTASTSSLTSSISTKRRRAREQSSSEEIYRVLYSNISKELPSPTEADTLFGVYFSETHIDYPFLHPPSLIDAYNALAACVKQGYNGIVDRKGWIEGITSFSYNGTLETVDDKSLTPISVSTAVSHVFLVFSIAAKLLTRTRNFDFSPTRFYKVAVDAAIEGVPRISLTSLQSVLLLTVQGMVGPADFNIWTLTHIAMSHCIDLGLHREPKASTHDTRVTRAIRSLVFYTVYHLDRSISTIQGRPLGIRDETFDVQLPDWHAIPNTCLLITGGPHEFCHYLSWVEDLQFSIHRLKLDRYISEIKLLFYHLPTVDHAVTFSRDHQADQTRIKAALDDWLTGIKTLNHYLLDVDKHSSPEEKSLRLYCKKLKLEVLYHGAVTLLHQPSQVLPRPTHSALLQCYESSRARIRIYNDLHDKQNLFFNWRNIHGIFAAGATIVFCFWASRDIQLATTFADALRDLRMCSNLLSIGGQWWPSVGGGRESFDKIVDLTIRRLSSLQNHNPPTSHGESNQTRLNNGSAHFGNSDTESQDFPDSFHQSNITADPTREPETEDITSLMESFLADCLHGDWSWDPLSSFANIEP